MGTRPDRIIAATARAEGLTLLTHDDKTVGPRQEGVLQSIANLRNKCPLTQPASPSSRWPARPPPPPTSTTPPTCVREAARAGAQIICLPELFRAQYFCQREDHRPLRPRRAHPRPHHRAPRRQSPAKPSVVVIASPLRAPRPRPLPQHRRRARQPTATLAGIYRKMHIPDDPLYYEKFYFTPGDLGFRAFDTSRRPHRHAGLLGPVVPRGRPPHRPAGRRASSSTPPPSAGTPPRRPSSAPRSTTPGRPSSAPTPSPTASSSAPSTASATSTATSSSTPSTNPPP